MSITRNRLQKILPWLVLALILAVSFYLRSRYLWIRAMTYDEGHWLMFAVLSNAGYTPYSVTFVGIPPLALLTIQLGVKLFDISLAIRYPMMIFSLVGIGSLFLSLRPWKNTVSLLAGLLAAVFLSFDLDSFRGSSTFMGEVPAVSMAILSFALVQQYYTSQKVFWLVLSGIAFGLSLAFKLFVVFFPLLIGIVVLTIALRDNPNSKFLVLKQLVVAGAAWSLGVIIPWIVFFIFYHPRAMYQQIFLFRLAFRDINLSQNSVLLENSIAVAQMINRRLPLLVGSLIGFIIGWRERRLDIWGWFIWLILAIVPLIWQSPLRPRYSVMLLPPLVALSGVATVYIGRWFIQGLQRKKVGWIGEGIAVLFLVGIIFLALTVPVKSLLRTPDPYIFPNLNFDVVRYIESTTTEDDCIVTDDQRFAFASNRLVPAALSETAQGRLATGWLTAEDIVNEIQTHDCPAVVYMVDYFDTFLPHLRTRLHALYFLEITYDEHFVVFTGKKHVAREPETPVEAQLGPAIILKGYDLTASPWRSGQEVRLATYWAVLEPPGQAYKIFVQLRNSLNETVTSFDYFPFAAPNDRYRLFPDFEYQYRVVPNIDSQTISAEDIAVYPAKGMVPTNTWPVGNTIREVKTIKLPDLTTGTYNLYLGMYDPDTLTRLKVRSQSEESNMFWLGQVEVIGR